MDSRLPPGRRTIEVDDGVQNLGLAGIVLFSGRSVDKVGELFSKRKVDAMLVGARISLAD